MNKLKNIAVVGAVVVLGLGSGAVAFASPGNSDNGNDSHGKSDYCHNNGKDKDGKDTWTTVSLNQNESKDQGHQNDEHGKCKGHDQCKAQDTQSLSGEKQGSDKSHGDKSKECPVDVCNNIEGVQTTVPVGDTVTDGVCAATVVTQPTVTNTTNNTTIEAPLDSSFQGK